MSRPIRYSLVLSAVILLLLLAFATRMSPNTGRMIVAVQQVAAGTETSDCTPADAEDASPVEATAAGTETTGTETAAADTAPPEKVDKATRMLGGGPEKIKLTEEEREFVELVNKERRSRDIPEVKVAPLLVKTARAKSQEMHDLNYWGHESPDKKRRTAMYRVLDVLPEQPQTMLVGENLYFCTEVLVESGHKALMNSPTHRKNILNPEYKYIGIGGFIAKDKRFWVTEHFLKINY